jgi:hypothetical protein
MNRGIRIGFRNWGVRLDVSQVAAPVGMVVIPAVFVLLCDRRTDSGKWDIRFTVSVIFLDFMASFLLERRVAD